MCLIYFFGRVRDVNVTVVDYIIHLYLYNIYTIKDSQKHHEYVSNTN